MKRITTLLLLALTASLLPLRKTMAQAVGTTFEVDQIKYTVSKADLTSTPKVFEAKVLQVNGSGTRTVPASVTHPQSYETVKIIGVRSWNNASPNEVTGIILSEGITILEGGSFNNCKGLRTLKLPASLETFEQSSLTWSPNLEQIEVALDNPYFAHSSDKKMLLSKDQTVLFRIPEGVSGDIAIPNTVTELKPTAVWHCRKLQKITIPASVAKVDTTSHSAFKGSGRQYEVDASSTTLKSINGVLFSKDGKTLIAFPSDYKKSTYAPTANTYRVPDGTTRVTSRAFNDLINFPQDLDLNQVKTLRPDAIESGPMQTIRIGAALKDIQPANFTSLHNLTSYVVNAANQHYKSDRGVLFTKDGRDLIAFPKNKKGSYSVPAGTERILKRAFYACGEEGKTITLPTTLKHIQEHAFGATYYTQLVISQPSQLESIGRMAFRNSKIGGTFTVPASVKEMGSEPFGQMQIEVLRFEQNSQLTTLPWGMACNMPRLKRVEFEPGAKVKKLDNRVFYNCPELESVDIPASVTEINPEAFQYTPKLQTVNFLPTSSLKTIRKGAFAHSGISNLQLPASLTRIEQLVFENCQNLTSVHIPALVTTIEVGAFNFCESLTSISVDDTNTSFSSVDGILFSKDKQSLITYPAGKGQNLRPLPPTFNKVGAYAFYSSNSITDIIIPRSVTQIEERAIALCPNVKTIRLMGKENVPTLSSGILFNSADPSSVEIYVRKDWYENPANQTLVQQYENIFKHVRRSFVTQQGHDRGLEFFQTSSAEVGVIAFEDERERTSVIVPATVTQPSYRTLDGSIHPESTFAVTSVLDYAFDQKSTSGYTPLVKAITFLGDINKIGLNAFSRSSIQQVFFVGDTPADLDYANYAMPEAYPFGTGMTAYVKPSRVADYRAAWNADAASVGREVAVESRIPQATAGHGGSVCFPFDVVYPSTDGSIVPYVAVDYTRAGTEGEGIVRAYSLDNGYVPAFVGAILRSEYTPALQTYCEMDEAQAHSTTTLEAAGYQADGYPMVGAVEDEVISTPSGYKLYAFSRSKGGFVPLNNGAKFPYFKAYLRLPVTAGTKGFRISFLRASELTDGITDTPQDATQEQAPAYLPNGTQATAAAKGLHIRGGKKFLKR